MNMAREAIVQRLLEQGLGLLVESEGRLTFASDRRGMAPLKTAVFEHPDLLDGSDVALREVGLAAAYLLIYAKAGRVYSQVMTREARAALADEGIEHRSDSFVKKLSSPVPPTGTLDAQAQEAVTPQAFVEAFRHAATEPNEPDFLP